MQEQYDRIKKAEKGAMISLGLYLFLATVKTFIGIKWSSSALRADGLNNLTDVASSIAILIGLKAARKPPDEEHRYGHWKAEPIASLLTSVIMLLVGLQVTYSSVISLLNKELESPNRIAGWAALASAVLLFVVYRYNASLAKQIDSSGLKAVSKDNLSDALTSSVTGFAIFASQIQLPWLDGVMAFLVGLIILKTGYEVFRDSAFSLSDGFDIEQIALYKSKILSIPGVEEVRSIKGRMYGANAYLDVTILVHGDMTVQEGHEITRVIEKQLFEEYDVMDIDVHVEPVENRQTQKKH